MRTRYLVAGAATLLAVCVAITITVTSLGGLGRDTEPAPGRLVSDAPVLFRPTVRAPAPLGMRMLDHPAAYEEYAGWFDGADSGLAADIRELASSTGHIAFHQPVGCDSVTGPSLRHHDGGYIVAFADRVGYDECYAPAEALVVFVRPGPGGP